MASSMRVVFENCKMQLRQIRVNKSALCVMIFMIWTILISGLGKVDYSMSKSEMALCLRLFEKEWREGPNGNIDIKYEPRDSARNSEGPKDSRKDSRKSTDSQKNLKKDLRISDPLTAFRKEDKCSECKNEKLIEEKERAEIMKTINERFPKEALNNKNSKNIKDSRSDQTEIVSSKKANADKQIKEQKKTVKNENTNVSLNSKTLKSLKSNLTSKLTNMFHRVLGKPYLIENPTLCSSVTGLKVLIIVHSATKNFEKRMVMRETWTNNSFYPNLGPVRTMFLLGRTPNTDTKARINQEFKKHGDILQGDFMDTYHNLTLKGVTAYKWVTEKCRNAKVILKVDDDVIINMFHFLTETIPFITSKSKHVACRRSAVARVNRNPNNKWFVEKELFSEEKIYPEYCEGFTVAFSNDLLPSLFKSAMLTPFFWIDDVYLYGLVPRNIPNVHYSNLTFAKDVLWGIDKIKECLTNEKKCSHFVFLLLKHATVKVKKVWSLILNLEGKTKVNFENV